MLQLSNMAPLRQMVSAAQAESISRLVEYAKEGADRGEDVKGRLDMLISLQEASSNPGTPSKQQVAHSP